MQIALKSVQKTRIERVRGTAFHHGAVGHFASQKKGLAVDKDAPAVGKRHAQRQPGIG